MVKNGIIVGSIWQNVPMSIGSVLCYFLIISDVQHPDVMAQDTNQGYLLLTEGNYLIRNSSILKFYFLKFKNLHVHSQKENLFKKKLFVDCWNTDCQ